MPASSPPEKPASIIPLVLSGGAGTRLWPVSRDSMPKQFLSFGGKHSLLQDTLLRCSGKPFADRPIIVSLAEQSEIIQAQAAEIGMATELVLEPARRDSCAAVLAGAWHAIQRDADAIVMILAADHHISDAGAFRKAVDEAAEAARRGKIVTFGIKPAFPATGYGYILPGEAIPGTTCALVARFREKPARDVAESYILEGCLWNSGNFLVKAKTLAEHAKAFVPDIWQSVSSACERGTFDAGIRRPDEAAYAATKKISFDYAIMEKTTEAAVKSVAYDWSDIGTWDSVGKILPADAAGNASRGPAVALGGSGNIIFSDGPLTVVQGLDDIIVIATKDTVLVTRKGESEKVKSLVEELARRGIKPGSGQ